MSKARIAVFEGYGAPLFSNPRTQRLGFSPRTMPKGMGGRRMGAPLYSNPNTQLYGYGRRGYRVDPYYVPSSYGPITESGRHAKKLKRKGYKVKKARNSKWQSKFKKVAKKCARLARGKRKGAYQSCMRKSLKKARRSRR